MTRTSRKLRRRLTALGLAIVASLAFAGLAAGSASAVSISPQSLSSTLTSTSEYVVSETSQGSQQCAGIAGNGKFSGGSAGTYSLTFTNCKSPLGGYCTTSGQAAGVIKTKPLTINLEYIDSAKTKFGIGFKPTAADNVFAEFSCGYSVTWTGGMIGEVTAPGLNSPASNWTLDFASTGTPGKAKYNSLLPTQEWLESGGKKGWYYNYAMQEKKGSGSALPMAILASTSMSFGGVPATALP